MTNSKFIVVLVAIIIAGSVGLMIVLNSDSEFDDSQSTPNESVLNISDSATVKLVPANNTNFVLDENGNKRYILSVVDNPDLSD